METSKFEKRRGRAKKRVEAIRNGQGLGLSSNDSNCHPPMLISVCSCSDVLSEIRASPAWNKDQQGLVLRVVAPLTLRSE